MIHAVHELRLHQHTALTPRLQQSVKLLQMSALEFNQEVRQALVENPFLEEDEEVAAASPHTHDGANADSTAEQAPAVTPPASSGEGGNMPEYSGDYPSSRRTHDGAPMDMGQWVGASVSLHERLDQELRTYRLSPRDRLLAQYIVQALDEDGYLRQPLQELADNSVFGAPPDESEWRAALCLVQQLDVPGLGARDLRECLTLQLQVLDTQRAGVALARRIVEQHLDIMARHDYEALQRAMGCSETELRQACDVVRSLDPRPGRRYDQAPPAYIVPDVIVRKESGQWRVHCNRGAVPQPRLHRVYADLFRTTRYRDRGPMAQELQEARWLVRNVEQRYSTIQRVAEAIVRMQHMFFEYGPVALRPLMLREVSAELDIHESTVSRATANKYMATPMGILEFKYFFSRELATDTGGSCSAGAVRALIGELIDNEDPRMPLSDVALASKLASDGIVVARRTVSKYRAQIKRPSAEMRRQY
ncbi:RNA polymerase factor sigma-54 [Bordetella sp. BOR01]|uniref:RNA polymerase factor sigma-54 n=1 Tax=Bordetella sp. BOR01 TaxID=2854779 RepID=UPI001C481060|nr:RNA polymerase factor sigma-54 [Bordetella sp. BOR01]MBV7486147.1 RNA polymerase factor sigma-54 [Bordetella sp. BOR01]